MQFRDLGPLVVETDDVERTPGGTRPAVILAVLLANANRRVSTDALIDAVWGEHASPRAGSTLESHIWRLRQVLEPGRARREAPTVLIGETGGYRLLARSDQVDSMRFDQLAEQLRHLPVDSVGAALQVVERCDDALGLWRGDAYDSLTDYGQLASIARRLEEVRAEVGERRIAALLAADKPEQALADLVPLLEAAPFREGLWAHRMLALYRTGRGEAALHAFRDARRTLLDEVGLEPGRQLHDLQHRILEHDDALLLSRSVVALTAVVTGAAAPEVPAPDVAHLPAITTDLIGRDRDLGRLQELIPETGLITIIGAAGCGKTRLAIEAAAATALNFPDGVWFVDLTSIDQAELVIEVVGATLGLSSPVVGSPLDGLRALPATAAS